VRDLHHTLLLGEEKGGERDMLYIDNGKASNISEGMPSTER